MQHQKPQQTPDDTPTIEVAEIEPSELESLAPYHFRYRALGFGEDTMVCLASTLVVPLARAEPASRKSMAPVVLFATAVIAVIVGSGCVAFGLA